MKCNKVWCLLDVSRRKYLGGRGEGLISPTLTESVVLEAKLNRVKRANFINKSLELSQEFYFASSRSKFRIKDTYNSHFYGSPIWNLFGKPCSSLLFCFVLFCSSLLITYNRYVRITLQLPLTTHRNVIEPITGSRHL